MAMMALPVIGALAGGAGASLLGFSSLTAIMAGASVGWMVGSWAMMSQMDVKNEPIDPGAHEAPRFNTAVRGSVMPVLFGTNRVPAQIPWQANYEAIRKTTSAGNSGGKSGGSGGGKGPKGNNTSVSYDYKIDAVYHIGMGPTQLGLIGGWLGGEKINDASITSIGVAGSGLAYVPTTVGSGQVGISYDEGVFFSGDIDESDTWSYLTSQVGAPIVWPGTAWVGFRGLNMGPNASMPQLNFEIGPAGFDFDVDSGFVASLPNINTTVLSKTTDLNKNCYVCDVVSNEIQVLGPDGTQVALYATDTLLADVDAHIVAVGGGVITLPASATFQGAAVVGEAGYQYLVIVWRAQVGVEVRLVSIWDITDAANITVAGCSWAPTSTLLGDGIRGIDLAGLKGSDDAVICHGYRPSAIGSAANYRVWTFPSVTDMYGAAFPCQSTCHIIDQSGVNQENISIFSGWWGRGNQQSWLLPYYDAEDLMVPIKNFLFAYTTKSGIDTNETYAGDPFAQYYYSTAMHDMYVAGYTDGFMSRADLGYLAPASSGSSPYGSTTEDTANTVDHLTDAFIDTSGVGIPAIVGTDVQTNIDGTANTNHEYWNSPAVTQYDQYTWIATWYGPMYVDNSYGSQSEFLFGGHLRMYYYSIIDCQFHPIGNSGYFGYESYATEIEGGPIAVYPSAFVNVADFNMFYSNDNQIFIWHHNGPAATSVGRNRSWLTTFGTLQSGATDVTPPYIIRQILINDVFGIQPGGEIIDETSYAIAHQYCIDNDILVSTQYRRTSGALAHIELLLALYGGWLTVMPANGTIKFGVMDLQNTPVRTIDNHHLVVRGEGDLPVKTSKGAIQDTYNLIKVNFIDRDLDYQNNQVEAADEVDQDARGVRPKEFPPDFVMSLSTAQKLADRALWSNLYTRDAHQFYLGWKDSDLEPGDMITLVDSFGGLNEIVHIVKWHEVDRGVYEVVATQQVPYVASVIPSAISSSQLAFLNNPTNINSIGYLSNSGTVVYSGIVTDPSCRYNPQINGPVPRPLTFEAYELPAEFSGEPGVYVNWTTDAFAAGATMYVSPDNTSFAPVQRVEPYAIAGKLLTALPDNVDQEFAENVEFILHPKTTWSVNSPDYTHNVTLNDVSPSAMHVGAGLMYVGSEMLAYTNLQLIAQNRYRAGRVYRGWGGTNAQAHSSGAVFVQHGSGIFFKEYDLDHIGTNLYYKVCPFNLAGYEYDVSSVTAKAYRIKGAWHRPAPASEINFAGARRNRRLNVGSDGDIAIDWQDAARKSGYGAGGYGTAPGGFGGFTTDTLSHSWRVEVVGSGSVVVRSTVVTTPNFTYTRSQNMADNGAWRGSVALNVTPFSPYGDAPRTSVISLELFY